eukprot:CAMPEP_0206601044 /NCGR_PEP_ID=MMETSP0325_2-20121206/46294_1 /ASSEMBLY_ACC=CAM_ASM_000347 /TAXON_ID=2866 /ORGANISM="Crypthecodinium cohnii, Strain Seligo" /LENGTH=53 /DNA_ID=CAMNT_0054112739 /DNA_START=131 /DNA_END=288 /DNA_ORIENTATION=+
MSCILTHTCTWAGGGQSPICAAKKGEPSSFDNNIDRWLLQRETTSSMLRTKWR